MPLQGNFWCLELCLYDIRDSQQDLAISEPEWTSLVAGTVPAAPCSDQSGCLTTTRGTRGCINTSVTEQQQHVILSDIFNLYAGRGGANGRIFFYETKQSSETAQKLPATVCKVHGTSPAPLKTILKKEPSKDGNKFCTFCKISGPKKHFHQ